jgi:hypothetical protein
MDFDDISCLEFFLNLLTHPDFGLYQTITGTLAEDLHKVAQFEKSL